MEEFSTNFGFSIAEWSPTLRVLFYSLLTAIATGLGALPFLFIKHFSDRLTHFADATAAGLMLVASFQLVNEGRTDGLYLTLFGIVAGFILLVLIKKNIDFDFVDTWKDMDRGDVSKIFLILGVMTLHSFAEGVGVGVSFARSDSFGMYISSAIALLSRKELQYLSYSSAGGYLCGKVHYGQFSPVFRNLTGRTQLSTCRSL